MSKKQIDARRALFKDLPSVDELYQILDIKNISYPRDIIKSLLRHTPTNIRKDIETGEINKNIFAKIVLYPLAREVGMMPKEASLAGGSNLTKFTVRFLNPDYTPYHFHGAEFSFGLTLIDVIGE